MEEKALEYYGWTIECQSPFELRHEDGSFASGQAANYLVDSLIEEYKDEVLNIPIVLVFTKDNNFCQVNRKHQTHGDREAIANNVRWLIDCAQSGIEESYSEDAPRRIEMNNLCNNLREQLISQIDADIAEQLKLINHE